MHKKILIPIPSRDFDPTECAVPWKILSHHGVQLTFATPDGKPAQCDQKMLKGKDLGFLAPMLMADSNAQSAYAEMENSNEFKNPITWVKAHTEEFDGLILPGGHAPGMREYLDSKTLQQVVAKYFDNDKPVGAICHGVVLAARSVSKNGKSVLFGRKTTSLLRSQELLAWALTCAWLGNYYRTYRQTVEAEVKANLKSAKDFIKGPTPLTRDSSNDLKAGFAVVDGNYVSSRWPGDAHQFANEFLKLLN